ncbi:MAG TPA: hypothetical protein VGR37_02600 [Longimicrobiaceae bacterium]|nr:hypothetical protein [Longimicrobiaceae bacterium]
MVVDFDKFTKTGARVFGGHAWGEEARRRACLDIYDQEPGVTVTVQLPVDLLAISPSFFRAMFGASIRALGQDFYRKYQFEHADSYALIQDVVQEAVADVLYGPPGLPVGQADPPFAGPATYHS